jgi:hypothetical protein
VQFSLTDEGAWRWSLETAVWLCFLFDIPVSVSAVVHWMPYPYLHVHFHSYYIDVVILQIARSEAAYLEVSIAVLLVR